MRNANVLALLELVALAGCSDAPRGPTAQASAASGQTELVRALAPRRSSRFACAGKLCRQSQPRLPDTAEWTCAEQGGVVWCAGGQAAAGVVPSAVEPSFRCGSRWGKSTTERVCIDRSPEHPAVGANFRCWFEQEQSTARVCETLASPAETARGLPPSSIAACWLDRDCPFGRCDRGACACANERDCTTGRCASGICVEAGP